MINNFQLFLYTVDEYKRFAKYLPVNSSSSLTGGYTEADYVGVQVRLMLLRKYYGSDKRENVNFRKLIYDAKKEYSSMEQRFQILLEEFNKVETQQLEHLLSDGTKLNIYDTIEDTVYGLYLHADEIRIKRLENTTEAMRFFCTRKYILEIENIIYKLYDLLKECGERAFTEDQVSCIPMVYLGDANKNTQSVIDSPYWRNLYGHDATADELSEIIQKTTLEERELLNFCIMFIQELQQPILNKRKLRKCVHPATFCNWGDFSEAKKFWDCIANPGISTRVRYNQEKDIAYVRIQPRVDEAFVIDDVHVIDEIYEFALVKCFGKWKIYSFGGHLDSIYAAKK